MIPSIYCPCNREANTLTTGNRLQQYACELCCRIAKGDPPQGMDRAGHKIHLCKGLRTGTASMQQFTVQRKKTVFLK